ncbi:M15 family peptidase [Candidatus Pacearchaeota archaeon]|nr:M15 family peptidase [Candidatus Pacearchaeota archaeon]
MPKFGDVSKMRLADCHQDLQDLFKEVVKHFDCSILCGFRNEEDQTKAYKSGKSKAQWLESFHNQTPSLAVDVVPYPIEWKDIKRFYMFVGFVRGVAARMGIQIRCGADWDGDTQVRDNNFDDLPHFELIP